jgi:hypothetical protein
VARSRDKATTACSLQYRNRRSSDLSLAPNSYHEKFPLLRKLEVLYLLLSKHSPFNDLDLLATHARTFPPAALASVSFGFVLVGVRLRYQDQSQRRRK